MNDSLSGFTLIELLIAMAIIGILASVMIPNLLAAQKRAFDTSAVSCAKSLQTVQAISQVDSGIYRAIGSGAGAINRTTDGVDYSCKQGDIYIVDRSTAATMTSSFTFDIWSTRGNRVITVTPEAVTGNAPGATAFSGTGAGGSNLP